MRGLGDTFESTPIHTALFFNGDAAHDTTHLARRHPTLLRRPDRLEPGTFSTSRQRRRRKHRRHAIERQQWLGTLLPNGLPEAGYLSIANNGEQAIDLLGASSPDFGNVMLHQSIGNGSTMRMIMVDKLTIPAHGKVDIAPGGYHLMLMAATHPIAPGATVQVVLKFSDGKTLTTVLPVRSAGGQ